MAGRRALKMHKNAQIRGLSCGEDSKTPKNRKKSIFINLVHTSFCQVRAVQQMNISAFHERIAIPCDSSQSGRIMRKLVGVSKKSWLHRTRRPVASWVGPKILQNTIYYFLPRHFRRLERTLQNGKKEKLRVTYRIEH